MKLAPPLDVEFRRLGRPKLLHASQIRSAVLVARDTRANFMNSRHYHRQALL